MKNKEKYKKTGMALRLGAVCLSATMMFGMAGCENRAGENSVVSEEQQETGVNGASESKSEPGKDADGNGTGESGAVVDSSQGNNEGPGGEEPVKTSTLAERLVGRYSAKIDDKEVYTLEVVNALGNLYAFGGYAFIDDSNGTPSYELYSFSTKELYPEDPRDLWTENATDCVVGVMNWSIQSNAGEYWGAPVKKLLKLTDDGISITDLDEQGKALTDEDATMVFHRDENVPKTFTYADQPAPALEEEYPPQDLYGIWREKGSERPLYLEFTHEGPGVLLYKKDPGEKAVVGKGFCYQMRAGRLYMVYNTMGTLQEMQEAEAEFAFSGSDTLTLDVQKSDDYLLEDSADGKITFERISWKDVPAAALVKPDDVDAITGELAIAFGDGTRIKIMPQFEACDDIENNGGNFVRVGKLVFFRKYLTGSKITGLYGNFTDGSELQKNSEIWYYDTRTKKYGKAFTDVGYGPVWYHNGRFYESQIDAETGSTQVMQMWPDGSGKSSITWQQYAVIKDMTPDGKLMCIQSYQDDLCYVTDGQLVNIPHSYTKPGKSSVTFSKFIGSKLILVENDPNEERDTLFLIDPDNYREICLGKLPKSDNPGWGMCSVEQVFREDPEGNEVYLGLAWYDGTAAFLSDYCVVKADLTKENSVKVVSSGIPDGFEEGSAPHFYLNYADEIMYTTYDAENPFVLSDRVKGDLVYLDSPHGANRIAKDFIKENTYGLEDGQEATFLQTAERIGNDVFVLTARAKRSAADDIGWREAFELIEFTWQVFEAKDGIFGDEAFGEAKILK